MPHRAGHLHAVSGEMRCEGCAVRRRCLPAHLDREDLDALSELAIPHSRLKRGQVLIGQGQPFRSLYALRAGSVKGYALSESGDLQITAFHLAGELIGVDAIGCDTHPTAVEAVEETWVCELPFALLEQLSQRLPDLQHELLSTVAREIRNEEQALMLVRGMRAERRVICFINSLLERRRQVQGDVLELPLPMAREDIASFLGLAPETLSRSFARLRKEGLIRGGARYIEVLDLAAVRERARCGYRLEAEGAAPISESVVSH